MSAQISRVELAEIAFQLGFVLATHAIENGIPISKVREFVPDFEGKSKQLLKVLTDMDKKDEQNKRKVKV